MSIRRWRQRHERATVALARRDATLAKLKQQSDPRPLLRQGRIAAARTQQDVADRLERVEVQIAPHLPAIAAGAVGLIGLAVLGRFARRRSASVKADKEADRQDSGDVDTFATDAGYRTMADASATDDLVEATIAATES